MFEKLRVYNFGIGHSNFESIELSPLVLSATNMRKDGDMSLAAVSTMFPNATVKAIKGGTFVAGQFVNYNIQPREHQTGMDNLAIYLTH